jgi:Ni/Fe-hydrogenase subunit HybB-like protein
MSKHIHSFNPNDPKVAKIADDVLRPVGFNSRFHAWMGFLSIILVACLYAYYIQLKEGLIVTGLRDYVSWGMYAEIGFSPGVVPGFTIGYSGLFPTR